MLIKPIAIRDLRRVQIRHRPELERVEDILYRNWRDQRVESAAGAQNQPVGRMLGPQPLQTSLAA